MSIFEIFLYLTVATLIFAAGILVGRANPRKADKLANIAEKLEKKVIKKK